MRKRFFDEVMNFVAGLAIGFLGIFLILTCAVLLISTLGDLAAGRPVGGCIPYCSAED